MIIKRQILIKGFAFFSSGGGDRTHDLSGMNRTLSPAELRRHKNY